MNGRGCVALLAASPLIGHHHSGQQKSADRGLYALTTQNNDCGCTSDCKSERSESVGETHC